MNNYEQVKQSFSIQAEKFATYHMSKAEYTDYLIRNIHAVETEHALDVAAGTCICGRAIAPYVKDGQIFFDHRWLLLMGIKK